MVEGWEARIGVSFKSRDMGRRLYVLASWIVKDLSRFFTPSKRPKIRRRLKRKSRWRLCGDGQWDEGGVVPEGVEVVVLAEVAVHYVDDDVVVVDDDPFVGAAAFGGGRAEAVFFFQATGDLVPNGADVGFVVAGSENEVVGDGGHITHIEHEDVFGFLPVGQLGAD